MEKAGFTGIPMTRLEDILVGLAIVKFEMVAGHVIIRLDDGSNLVFSAAPSGVICGFNPVGNAAHAPCG